MILQVLGCILAGGVLAVCALAVVFVAYGILDRIFP